MKQIKTSFTARYSDGRIEEIPFRLSETSKYSIGGILLWGRYYVDTLLEDYNDWLNGRILCVDGGSNLCILNMAEWTEFIMKNRLDIETKLREEKMLKITLNAIEGENK